MSIIIKIKGIYLWSLYCAFVQICVLLQGTEDAN